MFTRIALASIAAAVLSVVAATPSFAAGEASYDYPQAVASNVTRAEVRQAAIAARQAGLVTHGEITVASEIRSGASQLTRAQVLAELAEARRLGLVGEGEHNIFPTPAQLEQIRLAGLKAAMPMVAAR
jgi:hypothetical protein